MHLSEQFTPKQVAQAMMVSESSIKRWCDRGLINTVKTAGGHRRITLAALNKFLRDQDRRLADPSLLGLADRESSPRFESQDCYVPRVDDFSAAIVRGDEETAQKILQQAYATNPSMAFIAHEYIAGAMRAIGDAWRCDQVEVYQERRGCDMCVRLVDSLCRYIPPAGAGAPVAIGCSPSQDSYLISTKLVELVLRDAGWAATSLGSNLPLESIEKAVNEFNPKLVWVSVSADLDREKFAEDFNRFASTLPSDVVLLAGGRALDDRLRPQLQYTAYCDNLLQLGDFAKAMRRRSIDVEQSSN